MSKESSIPESVKVVIDMLLDKKVEDLQILDVSELVSYTDYFIIGSGNSTTHVKALADAVAALIKIPGVGGVRMEGDQTSSWVLIDGGEYILHLFQHDSRRYYNLEQLWEDAPRIAVA